MHRNNKTALGRWTQSAFRNGICVYSPAGQPVTMARRGENGEGVSSREGRTDGISSKEKASLVPGRGLRKGGGLLDRTAPSSMGGGWQWGFERVSLCLGDLGQGTQLPWASAFSLAKWNTHRVSLRTAEVT